MYVPVPPSESVTVSLAALLPPPVPVGVHVKLCELDEHPGGRPDQPQEYPPDPAEALPLRVLGCPTSRLVLEAVNEAWGSWLTVSEKEGEEVWPAPSVTLTVIEN